MEFTAELAKQIVEEDHDDWEQVNEESSNSSRWHTHYSGVYKNTLTGKYYEFIWQRGSTEYQDEGTEFYTDPIEAVEVIEKSVTVMRWVAV